MVFMILTLAPLGAKPASRDAAGRGLRSFNGAESAGQRKAAWLCLLDEPGCC